MPLIEYEAPDPRNHQLQPPTFANEVTEAQRSEMASPKRCICSVEPHEIAVFVSQRV